MKTITQNLLVTCLLPALLLGCADAEMASNDATTLGSGGSVTLVDKDGCLQQQDDPDGPCLPNPQNCASLVVGDNGDESCESCYDASGELISQTCGRAETAECSRLENDLGDTCTICRTAAGETYFDSCHSRSATTGAGGCETYTDVDGQTCEICYDETGDVVQRDCFDRIVGGACETWFEEDLRCERCVDDSGQVFESCEQRPEEPVSCSGFTAADGTTCVTCTDLAGHVVEHSCSDPQPVGCEEYFTDDGALCRVCYDANGTMVSQECDRELPPEVCHTYATETGECTICTDVEGTVTHRSCSEACIAEGWPCNSDADCGPGSACLEGACSCDGEPACELFTTLDGVLCEICGDLNNDGVVDEMDASCFVTPPEPVECWEEVRPDSTGGEPIVCTVCRSEEGGITEVCGGTVVPPEVRCEIEQSADGTVCEVCREPNGAVVHTSCSDLSCHEEWIPVEGPTDQAIPCQLCERDEMLESLACDMGNVCRPDDPNGTDPDLPPPPPEPEPGPDPLPPGPDPCGNVWMRNEPVQCGGNAWEIWYRETSGIQGFEPHREGEILRAYYAATESPMPILAYRIERAFDASFCSACDCPRGDVIFIYVSAAQTERLLDEGWQY